MQGSIAIINKIEDLLLCITALEGLFATRPSDVEEQRRRHGLIWYAIIPYHSVTGF